MKQPLILFTALALLPLSLSAQGTKKIVPDPGSSNGSSSTPYFSGYGGGIAQQITLGTALCTSSAIIFEVAMRADGTAAIPARSFTSLKLSLGYTSKAPSAMSNTFASNRTGTQTQVFSGAYTLPAQVASLRPFNIPWKLAKPFIYTRNSGNLLIEYEVPVAPTKSSYFLDCHKLSGSSGTSYTYGSAGSFSGPEIYQYACASNVALTPGGKAESVISTLSKNYPALTIWGFNRNLWGNIPLPLDLTGLGAPKNFLNVSPDLMFVLPLKQIKGGYEGRVALPIPADKKFMGQSLFSQMAFLDLNANKAGLVFTEGLSMTIQTNQAVSQLVGHFDYKSATGNLAQAGTGIVFQFSGSFN
jgi:hypothetical protein